MRIRGRDENGDILPVLGPADLVSGGEAVALLVKDRLTMYTGEWWENPEWGCDIPERIRNSRITEADLAAVSSALSAYIRETAGVADVQDVRCEMSGRTIRWSCTVMTKEGASNVVFSAVY